MRRGVGERPAVGGAGSYHSPTGPSAEIGLTPRTGPFLFGFFRSIENWKSHEETFGEAWRPSRPRAPLQRAADRAWRRRRQSRHPRGAPRQAPTRFRDIRRGGRRGPRERPGRRDHVGARGAAAPSAGDAVRPRRAVPGRGWLDVGPPAGGRSRREELERLPRRHAAGRPGGAGRCRQPACRNAGRSMGQADPGRDRPRRRGRVGVRRPRAGEAEAPGCCRRLRGDPRRCGEGASRRAGDVRPRQGE